MAIFLENESIEPTTVGLSQEAHEMLRGLKEQKLFAEMMDAYRFAIAYALAKGVIPPEISTTKNTIFNVGSFDPSKDVYAAISLLFSGDLTDLSVYKTGERLAEWGVRELDRKSKSGEIDFSQIYNEIS